MLHSVPVQEFSSREEAFDWLQDQEYEYADNFRFGWKDHIGSMEQYEDIRDHGCCGSTDFDITINGRPATIGCNYGH